jgi:hypothetical protein
MKNKVIFLDIDGVLATVKQYATKKSSPYYLYEYDVYPYDEKCVKILNEIIEETDAEIILSSDWSLHYTLEQMDGIFKHNGIIKSPFDMITQLAISMSSSSMNRGYSIDQYIKEHSDEFENYVIIDDLDIRKYTRHTDNQSFDYDNFVHCTRGDFEGIKQTGIKEKILKVLNKE